MSRRRARSAHSPASGRPNGRSTASGSTRSCPRSSTHPRSPRCWRIRRSRLASSAASRSVVSAKRKTSLGRRSSSAPTLPRSSPARSWASTAASPQRNKEAVSMATATLGLERVTPNVYTTTKLRGCNPSFVTTSDGVVAIDTPQLPTRAVAMRKLAESHGPIRYVINTEHHVDHIFGNYYFKGAGTVVHHQGVYDRFMVVFPDLDPFAYAAEAIPTDDPDGKKIVPERDSYYRDPNKAAITFTGDLTLRVGQHTFQLLHTPGHTPGQVAVYVPEEGVVFT